jgi:hypothetical protein
VTTRQNNPRMKKLSLLAAILLTSGLTFAQDYKSVLAKTFNDFDTSSTIEQKIAHTNKLGLIAKKWDKEWTAHYYVALSKTILSYMEKDNNKRDAYLDDAEKELATAVSDLGKDNDETFVLAAMDANARMAVDPANRWMKYGSIFSSNLEKAKEVNPGNPRMYYLQGTSKLFTPKAYGGGKKIAQPYFEKAKTLFEKESNDDITKPNWGKKQNEGFLAECMKEDKE